MEELHYTTSMQEAASLLSCRDFEVDYHDILSPEDGSNRNRFVLKAYTSKQELRDHVRDYHNSRTLVSPKTYDEKINMLRDILNKNRG